MQDCGALETTLHGFFKTARSPKSWLIFGWRKMRINVRSLQKMVFWLRQQSRTSGKKKSLSETKMGKPLRSHATRAKCKAERGSVHMTRFRWQQNSYFEPREVGQHRQLTKKENDDTHPSFDDLRVLAGEVGCATMAPIVRRKKKLRRLLVKRLLHWTNASISCFSFDSRCHLCSPGPVFCFPSLPS